MAFGLLSIPIDRASGPSIKVFVQVFTQAEGVEEKEPREKTVWEKRKHWNDKKEEKYQCRDVTQHKVKVRRS